MTPPAQLSNRLRALLMRIYPDRDTDELTAQVIEAFWPESASARKRARKPGNALWSQKDAVLITYGDSLIDGVYKPLDLLRDFLGNYMPGVVNGVHILPFFPFTSDDGFAVTDYRKVNPTLGDWPDISRIGAEWHLMSDLVLNHVSSQGTWFNAYRQGQEPYDKFFYEASPEDDLSAVVRPRTTPLLQEVETSNGLKHVWCTFSHDQVDFDFSNPEVMLEFLRILRFHISKGVRTLRLDAIAFLWKEVGSPSIHLRQTHEIVRLIRLLADYTAEPLVLLTETNVPNAENLSYFGNRNEAHMVYNFSLPPLLLHALLHGTSKHLNAWQMSMPPAQLGCTYFNFTASHDGIGMRPAEGLLSEEDIQRVIDTAEKFGGRLSMRKMPDGSTRTYEINIALFDALKGTIEGEDEWNIERFLCSQIIAMGLEGIPGFYIHSLLATGNDHDGVEKSGHNRAINRHRWHYPDLLAQLDDPGSRHARVFNALTSILQTRSKQAAFHPNATQFTLQLGEQLFGFWRQSIDRSQSIFAIHNLTGETISIPLMSLNLIDGDTWSDLISGEHIGGFGGDLEFAPYQCRWITN